MEQKIVVNLFGGITFKTKLENEEVEDGGFEELDGVKMELEKDILSLLKSYGLEEININLQLLSINRDNY